MTKVHQITPFLHVRDLEAALAFFCETLPFVLKYRESNYAYIELESCGVRMLEEPTRKLTLDGERYADVGYSENVLYPGIPEAIRYLVGKGFQLGVCTTKRVDFAERILKLFDIRDCFQFANGGDIGIHKHEQLAYLVTNKVIGIEAAMIGDRAVDIMTAHANGLRSVGVLWGHGTEFELLKAEAQLLLSHPDQLMEFANAACPDIGSIRSKAAE